MQIGLRCISPVLRKPLDEPPVVSFIEYATVGLAKAFILKAVSLQITRLGVFGVPEHTYAGV